MAPSPTRHSRRDHLAAAWTLLLFAAFFIAATPGFDNWNANSLKSPASREEAIKDLGPVIGRAAIATADINRAVRLPLARLLVPAQRVFRVRQSWALFGGGPGKVRELEVVVDGRVVYRTRDAEHAWRSEQLGNRRVRPMIDSLASKSDAFNWKGMGRYLVTHAREDFPGATEVVIRATRQPYGGTERSVAWQRVARAPAWELVEEAP